MISVQNFFNSTKRLQKNSLSTLKRNVSLVPSRQIINCFNSRKQKQNSLPKHRQNQRLANDPKGKSSQHMRRQIRKLYNQEFQDRKLVPVKECNKVACFLKINIERSKLSAESRLRYSCQRKSDSSQERQQVNQINKTLIPTLSNSEHYTIKKMKYKGKQSEAMKKDHDSKPKITILSKILNAKHLKEVKQIVNSTHENNSQVSLSSNRNILQLKFCRQALQRVKSVYEPCLKTQNKQSKKDFLFKQPHQKSFSKQNFQGWTISEFAQQQKFQDFLPL